MVDRRINPELRHASNRNGGIAGIVARNYERRNGLTGFGRVAIV
jgi:hypothetical protein